MIFRCPLGYWNSVDINMSFHVGSDREVQSGTVNSQDFMVIFLLLTCTPRTLLWGWGTGCLYTPAQRSWRGGILDSPCPSVRLSVCRRHGFRSISQVCFGISISNFICMLMVAIGRSLLIFSDVTFKMAAWRPYWIFWFPDSNFTFALNINIKLQRHNTYVYG